MSRKIRILPLAIILLSMVFGIKVVDFSVGVEQAFASSESAEQANEKAENTPNNQEATAENEPDDAAALQLSTIPTRKELEYLQKLGERRVELDRREQELDDREKLLEAVEMRIVERTASLRGIEETISGLLKQHDVREQAQLDSLVKMYSAMKAKEAAKIFNSLDPEVLISIVENMKEKDMGKILAAMDTAKAKALTTSLATRKKLPKIEG